MTTQTKDTQQGLNPLDALNKLKEGNIRFLNNNGESRQLLTQVNQTSTGQFPFAVVLSCIDSRVPVEHILDQGIGDIFSARVAGNIINEDVLGSMEYSCKVAGSKLILVMGHTKCGAVKAACDGVELGNITPMLAKIKPAISNVQNTNSSSEVSAEDVANENVKISISQIRAESPILAEMEQNGEIKIVGASYSVENGKVTFFD